MSKFVVLNIDEGSFEQGFPVSIGVGEEGQLTIDKGLSFLLRPIFLTYIKIGNINTAI